MREFLLKASRGVTGNFSLNDLPGAGRMDLICRSVTAALWISDDLRRDTIFHVVLEGKPDPPKMVSFNPCKMRRVYPDERNIAAHIRKAVVGNITKNGITVTRKGFEEVVREKMRSEEVVYLDPDGKDIRKVNFEENVCFVIGDNVGLNEKTKVFLEDVGVERISVGPKVYLSSVCIAVVQNEMDRIKI